RTASPQMKHGGHVGVVKARGCTGLAQKPTADRFVADISFADHLKGYGTSEIDIERFVSDAHGATSQLDRSTLFIQHQLIVLKPAGNPGRTSLLEAIFWRRRRITYFA